MKSGFGPGLAGEGSFCFESTRRHRRHAAGADARGGDAPAFHLQRHRQADGGDVVFKALADLVGPHQAEAGCGRGGRRPGLQRPGQRHLDAGQHLVGRQRGLAVGQVEILDRQGAFAARAGQHQPGAQGDEQRHGIADGRAVGHVAAERAALAHRQAGEAVEEAGELRAVGRQRGEGVVQRGGGADGQVRGAALDAQQLGAAGDVDDLREVPVLLGDPQADVGAASHDERLRLRRAQRHQLGQGGGAGVEGFTGVWSQIGLQPFRGGRKQLQFL